MSLRVGNWKSAPRASEGPSAIRCWRAIAMAKLPKLCRQRGRKEVAMGADLYIQLLHQPAVEEWHPKFERAVRARGEASDETSRQAAQLQVEEAYEQMHNQGYFRDSYNNWN